MAATTETIALAQELKELASKLLGVAAKLAGEVPEPEFEFEEEERQPRPEEDVGRFGRVNETVAKVRASMLGQFDRQQFAEAVGLKPVKAGKWLTKLLEADLIEFEDGIFYSLVPPDLRDWVIAQESSFVVEEAAEAIKGTVEEAQDLLEGLMARGIVVSVNGNGRFRYEPPPNTAPRSRPRHMPPERGRPSYELALATGEPVRVRAVDKATRRQRSTAGAGGIKGAKARDRRYNQAQQAKQERAEANKTKAQRQPKFKSHSAKRSRPAA